LPLKDVVPDETVRVRFPARTILMRDQSGRFEHFDIAANLSRALTQVGSDGLEAGPTSAIFPSSPDKVFVSSFRSIGEAMVSDLTLSRNDGRQVNRINSAPPDVILLTDAVGFEYVADRLMIKSFCVSHYWQGS
jgi:hypothetical protein